MKATRFHIYVNKSDIIYLNAVLDSYEGLAIMRTVDEHKGEITLYTSYEQEAAVRKLLDALSAEGLSITLQCVDNVDSI